MNGFHTKTKPRIVNNTYIVAGATARYIRFQRRSINAIAVPQTLKLKIIANMTMRLRVRSIAKEEGNYHAAWSFHVANMVEQVHADLFFKAVDALRNEKELAETNYYVCSVCGNTVESMAPEKCPICAAPKKDSSR